MSHIEVAYEDEEIYESFSSFDFKRSRTEPRFHGSVRRYDRMRPKKPRLSVAETSREQPNTAEDTNFQAVIIDNGSYSLKYGLATAEEPSVMPNCIMKAKSERKRLFIGNQIDECRDCSGLYFLLPCERGYITKWDVQKPIWDYAFSKNSCCLNDNPVLMTQPLFNFKSIQDCIDEIFFEEYEIAAMYRANGTDFARMKYIEEIGSDSPCIIVDSGFSFTHIVPYVGGKKYYDAIKRINVGGKLLTNHLKDIISYRQYHVMEETYVINQVKEDTCYVSQDFKKDLKTAELRGGNDIIRSYVLPDFNTIRRGYIHDPSKDESLTENCQILRLNNERFCVPEILFHPSDIGIKNMGVAEAVAKSILSCPLLFQKQLAKNIILFGGNINFPGFKDRLYSEVRSLLPDTWEINVFMPNDPVTYAWTGGKSILKRPDIKNLLVTKEEYEEQGPNICQKKFNDWSSFTEEKVQKQSEVKPVSFLEHIKKYNIFGKEDATEEEPQNDDPSASQTSKNPEPSTSKASKLEEGKSTSNDTPIDDDPGESNSTSDSFRLLDTSKNNSKISKNNRSKVTNVEEVFEEEEEDEEETEEPLFADDIFPFGVSYL